MIRSPKTDSCWAPKTKKKNYPKKKKSGSGLPWKGKKKRGRTPGFWQLMTWRGGESTKGVSSACLLISTLTVKKGMCCAFFLCRGRKKRTALGSPIGRASVKGRSACNSASSSFVSSMAGSLEGKERVQPREKKGTSERERRERAAPSP